MEHCLPQDFVHSLFRLDGKVALITGGASGLGAAIVEGFCQAGARVIVADSNGALAQRVADRCVASGGLAESLQVDVTRKPLLEEAARELATRYGGVNVLVNSAAISERHAAEDFPEENWDRVIATNLKGTFLSCQAFGRHMLQRGEGSIINIASVAGAAGFRQTSAYAQSKGAIIQMTRCLAVEWIDRGVRVNTLAPATFETPALHAQQAAGNPNIAKILARTPIGRFGRTEEIVGPALFLASSAASMVTGHTLAVDGGYLAA